VRKPESARSDWAATELALGLYARKLGEITRDPETLTEAEQALRAALGVYPEDARSAAWADAEIALARTLQLLSEHDAKTKAAKLKESVEIAERIAQKTANTLPIQAGTASVVRGRALETLAGKFDRKLLCQALDAHLKGWSMLAKDAALRQDAAQRVKAIAERTHAGKDCKALPKELWTEFQTNAQK
jgi:hypothetical protein